MWPFIIAILVIVNVDIVVTHWLKARNRRRAAHNVEDFSPVEDHFVAQVRRKYSGRPLETADQKFE